MDSRNTCDIWGGGNFAAPIDRMLGRAFREVKCVSDSIENVQYVAANLDAINLVAKQYQLIADNTDLLTTINSVVRGVGGESLNSLPVAASRQGKYLGFDGTTGQPNVYSPLSIVETAICTPEMFGADPTGTVDSSAAFTAAFAAGKRAIICSFGAIYLVKDVTIAAHCIIYGNSCVFRPASGIVACMFKLTSFRPSLVDCYFDGTNGNLASSLGASAAVIVQTAVMPTIRNCSWVGWHVCLMIGSTTDTTETKNGTFKDLMMNSFDSRGLLLQGTVINTCTFNNMRIYSGTVPASDQPGKSRAQLSAIGFQMVTTGAAGAGGHLIENVDCEGMLCGFQFTDVTLTTLDNCIADSISGDCYQLTGVCDRVKFNNCYAGAASKGYTVGGSCLDVWIANPTFAGLELAYSWMTTDFYQAGGPLCLNIAAGAQVIMGGGWFTDIETGHTMFIGAGANITFDNDIPEHFGSITPTATDGSTLYLVYGGSSNIEFPGLIAHKPGIITQIITQNNIDPGVGHSFTYNVRKNSVNSGIQTVLNGSSSPTVFQTSSKQYLLFAQGDNIDISIVPSSGASAASHRAVLSLRYFDM